MQSLPDTEDDNDPEYSIEYASDHTISMRKAASHCLSILSSTTPRNDRSAEPQSLNIPSSMIQSCQFQKGHHYEDIHRRRQRRKEAYDKFWGVDETTKSTTTKIQIPKLLYSDIVSPQDFQRRFQHDNIPCLIDFNKENPSSETESLHDFFGYLDRNWRKEQCHSNPPTVNREWFINVLGPDTPVPVRLLQLQQEGPEAAAGVAVLDDDGRATECVVKSIPLKEWTEYLKRAGLPDIEGTDGVPPSDNKLLHYLKDWHLQLELQSYPLTSTSSSSLYPQQQHDLYLCPPIFEYDLLNSFQRRFTNGDYRFCYWGPKGSFTSRHSDVLHSFSWSYNVHGTKRWTFFRDVKKNVDDDGCVDDGDDHDKETTTNTPTTTFTVIQKSGQAIFVPSQWQHEVMNIEETISINHNWITVANIDQCWECLRIEMVAITNELRTWDDVVQNSEVEESMLRGCVGLDVTAFLLMIMVRLCDLLLLTTETAATEGQEENGMEFSYLQEMLRVVVLQEKDESIDIQGRLHAVLQSKSMVSDLLQGMDKLLSDDMMPICNTTQH